MIVITAATGNIGSKLTEILLSKGKKLRVVGRDAKKLEKFKGAEPFAGNAANADEMTKAFTGAESVFMLIPPKYDAEDIRVHYKQVGEAYVQAVRNSGVKEIVFLSSIGAHTDKNNGPIAALHDQEQRLNALKDVKTLHLRPGYFMENLFWGIPVIKQSGINGSALKGNVPLNMIATRDIAQYAAVRLMTGIDRTTSQELLGERDVTLETATELIGKEIGKPDLKYVQFSYEDAEKAMIGMGMGKTTAKIMNEMNKGFNEGLVKPTERRTKDNTTLTSIEAFAKIFAEVYKH